MFENAFLYLYQSYFFKMQNILELNIANTHYLNIPKQRSEASGPFNVRTATLQYV